jgi:hypothetical protein
MFQRDSPSAGAEEAEISAPHCSPRDLSVNTATDGVYAMAIDAERA